MIKAIDKIIEFIQNLNKRTESLNNRVENINEQYDTPLEAIKLLFKISEKDNDRINILKQEINLLEKENVLMKKQLDYLEKHHSIFW